MCVYRTCFQAYHHVLMSTTYIVRSEAEDIHEVMRDVHAEGPLGLAELLQPLVEWWVWAES